MKLNFGLKGFYDLFFRNIKTGKISYVGRADNLITNTGMNAPARYAWAKLTEVCVVGTGTTAAQVTDTKLESFLARSTTYADGANGVTFPNSASGDYSVIDYYRTYLAYSNTSGESEAISEIGVTWDDSDDPDIFSHVVLSTPVSVPDGVELLIRYTLRIQFPSDTFRTWKTMTMTIGSQEIPGRIVHCPRNYSNITLYGMAHINSSGNSVYIVTSGDDEGRAGTYRGFFEPSVEGGNDIGCGIDAQANTSATSCEDTRYVVEGTLEDYVEDSHQIVRHYTFPASLLTGRTDLRNITVGQGYVSSNYLHTATNQASHQVRFLADEAFTKPATVQWDIYFTLSWSRSE